jgi:hypothetical protein
MLLFRCTASSPDHVVSTRTLATDDVTIIIEGTTWVAIARLTTVSLFRQPPVFRQALVTVTSGDVSLARALAIIHITTLIVDCSENVASAALTTGGVVLGEVPEAVLADVAPATLDVGLAMAASRHEAVFGARDGITDAAVQRSVGVAVARSAHFGVLNVPEWVSVKEGFALFAVGAHGVVLAAVAHSSADASGGLVQSRVKVTTVGVVVTIAFFTSVRLFSDGRSPR